MSQALYKSGGLRFWDEDEIEYRELFQKICAETVKRALTEINPAFRHFRMEGPILTPANAVSTAYSSDDIYTVDSIFGGQPLKLRAETTASAFSYAKKITGKLPILVWQVGKSFRKETNDGASAAKLRFNEFWQQEFQIIYREDTKADYRQTVIDKLIPLIEWFTDCPARVVDSDRLPSYSSSTIDIELMHNNRWTEVTSCSIRTDFKDGIRVAEIAMGLCRITAIACHNKKLREQAACPSPEYA